jgi:hypothetical protein
VSLVLLICKRKYIQTDTQDLSIHSPVSSWSCLVFASTTYSPFQGVNTLWAGKTMNSSIWSRRSFDKLTSMASSISNTTLSPGQQLASWFYRHTWKPESCRPFSFYWLYSQETGASSAGVFAHKCSDRKTLSSLVALLWILSKLILGALFLNITAWLQYSKWGRTNALCRFPMQWTFPRFPDTTYSGHVMEVWPIKCLGFSLYLQILPIKRPVLILHFKFVKQI